MNQPLFYQCVVLDNQDPLMLGRVRARLLTDNYNDMVKSFDDPPWNEEKDKWGNRDPFIFNPLLPFFIYQVPKVDEMVNVLYYNSDFQYRNQFYIQALFSTPTTSPFEYYVGTQKMTGIGVQYTNAMPIKNQNGTYQSNTPKGVFPEPGDNAILGRGNADIVVKENGVLIRANKLKGSLRPNVMPVANNKGAFLQLEKFDVSKTRDIGKTITELLEDVMITKYLIEYVVINPENSQNKYSGFVYLYKLKSNSRINTKEIRINSEIDDLKSLIIVEEFRALSFDDTVNFINGFIKQLNDKNRYNGRNLFNPTSKFPIFYRPSPSFYSLISSKPAPGPNLAYNFSSNLFNKIKLNSSAKENGFGLIYAENKVGTPYKVKKSKIESFKYNSNPVTYGSIGADKVFLLSQTSSIPGKGTINFDGTIYGISNEKYVKEIIPKTSSLVRGEELIELIDLIVRFLITHTHSYPGMPPVRISFDGTSTEQILTEIQNASNKILNANIRLN